jgi:hypothetical protein
MSNLKAELERLDGEIQQKTDDLKRLKKARRKLAGALEQLNLTI